MACRIFWTTPPGFNPTTSSLIVISRCETRNFEGGPIVDDLCPIGRIEKATKDAIAHIKAMVDDQGF